MSDSMSKEELERKMQEMQEEKGIKEVILKEAKGKIVDIVKKIWIDSLGKSWSLNLEEEATLKREFEKHLETVESQLRLKEEQHKMFLMKLYGKLYDSEVLNQAKNEIKRGGDSNDGKFRHGSN